MSFWNPLHSCGEKFDHAADKYFRNSRRPSISETIAYYQERKIGLVMFTVDAKSQMGRLRIPNVKIAEAAKSNGDIMVSFASIDMHKDTMGALD